MGDFISVHRMSGVFMAMLCWSCVCMCSRADKPDPGVVNPGGSPAKDEYDPSHDGFYRRRPIYVTWIMIWNGSTEKHWWKPTDYQGCRVFVDGSWESIDWNNKSHIETYCESIRLAGIDVIVADLTNGFRWEWQAKYVQEFCRDHGMKFAIAFNPHEGNKMESGCRAIWDVYASPDVPFSDAYLHRDGKPVAVLYTWREGYAKSIALTGTYQRNFTFVWASGEDSDEDKWGWQLEPEVGPVASKEAMFITGSVKFGSPKTKEDEWRKHLSWLDYGFIMANRNGPKYVIVGSFDDVHERNAWMVVDTADADKGWQMRDKGGAINRDAYYKRVCEWLKGKPSTIEGGVIPDGAYVVKCSSGNILGTRQNRRVGAEAVLNPYRESIENLIWFYHLGGNVYRLIKLNAGLPLESTKSSVFLNWDCDAKTQRWIVEKSDDRYRLLNVAGGEVLGFSDTKVVTEARDDASASQYWSLVGQAVISETQAKRESRLQVTRGGTMTYSDHRGRSLEPDS